jgi:broad specificity phosphatase PhoE
LDSYFTEIGIHAENITLLASPFLRTIQTADNLLAEFVTTPGNVAETVNILPESSVWELDGGMWDYHSSLPTSMEERTWYYPRIDESHQSLFIPTLPESREDFLLRCDQVIQDIHTRYGFVQKSAIIVVTHAAGCIALARSAAGLTLQDINPAPPCGMYILTRSSSDTHLWSLDHHAIPAGANGFVGHVTDLGQATHPWNHFGNKKENNGYTGPPRADE